MCLVRMRQEGEAGDLVGEHIGEHARGEAEGDEQHNEQQAEGRGNEHAQVAGQGGANFFFAVGKGEDLELQACLSEGGEGGIDGIAEFFLRRGRGEVRGRHEPQQRPAAVGGDEEITQDGEVFLAELTGSLELGGGVVLNQRFHDQRRNGTEVDGGAEGRIDEADGVVDVRAVKARASDLAQLSH